MTKTALIIWIALTTLAGGSGLFVVSTVGVHTAGSEAGR